MTHEDVKFERATVVSTSILDESYDDYVEKVKDPLESLGFDVDEMEVQIRNPTNLTDAIIKYGLELLEGESATLFDITHGARIIPFTASMAVTTLLRALTFKAHVTGEEGFDPWRRVAFCYCAAELRNQPPLVMDVTDHVLYWRLKDSLATYLADPFPRWTGEVKEAGAALKTDVGVKRWVESLEKFAKIERASAPGPVYEEARDRVITGDVLAEFVWEILKEVFTGGGWGTVDGPFRDVVREGSLTEDEREEIVRRLRDVRGFLEAYCRYVLDRGRTAEAASLMNDVHMLLYVFAKLIEPFHHPKSYEERLGDADSETVRVLKELAAATLDELYCKLFDPFRGRPGSASGSFSRSWGVKVKGEDVVWSTWSDVRDILGEINDRTGEALQKLPFKRSLRLKVDDLKVDIEGRSEPLIPAGENPVKAALESPPIARIRNKLQHADPLEDRRKHAELTELCRAHLKLTLRVIDGLARILGSEPDRESKR